MMVGSSPCEGQKVEDSPAVNCADRKERETKVDSKNQGSYSEMCPLTMKMMKGQVNRMCNQRGLEDEGQNHNTGNRIHSNSTCGTRGPVRAGARRYLEELQLAVQHWEGLGKSSLLMHPK